MEDASTSGFIVDAFEGVNANFTSIEVLKTHGHNRLARAKRFGRWYMLKALAPDEAEQAAYHEMLVKEFDIMMRLQHPGVVQAVSMEHMKSLGECIVMEWVEGTTLQQWLKGNTTRENRRQVAQQLIEAIEYIHKQGVVHRDIKPSNVMVTTNGQNVKIIDFGLADTDVHTELKQPAGTPRYMAPEQAAMCVSDPRNDIYSLGLVLEQLHLGKLYKRPIARCLLPIDKRYQSIEDLMTDLHRRESRRRFISIATVAILGMLLTSAITLMAVRINLKNDTIGRTMVDSLNRRLETTAMQVTQGKQGQDSLHQRLANLIDSLKVLNAANTTLRNEQEEQRQRLIDQTIAEGIRRIDAVNATTGMAHHLDTLSRGEYLWMDWNFQSRRGRNLALPKFMDEIHNRFSTKELSEIEYALTEHCTQYEIRLQKIVDKKKGFVYGSDRKTSH